MLYVVATPIGNLKDIGLRAIEVLKSVDIIACEDTRHSRILLKTYGITTATTSFFQHNQQRKGQFLLDLLKEGKSVALISDAGTPGILDPGYHLIQLAIAHRIGITVIPGPTALINALVVSGRPAHRFLFEGFLPVRSLARRNRLEELARLGYTAVIYESSHRILATLADIHAVFADRPIVCCRELTKKFEETLRGPAQEILGRLQTGKARGEFVIVL